MIIRIVKNIFNGVLVRIISVLTFLILAILSIFVPNAVWDAVGNYRSGM